MPPVTKLWPMPPQTVGKHIVLRAYLGAWLAILGQLDERLVFVDGYAGPGEYEGGEPGSPLIALDVFEHHNAAAKLRANVTFLFLEEHRGRWQHLDSLVTPVSARLGARANVFVRHGRFDSTMNELLDRLTVAGSGLAPAFVMVDPFGVSHLPMTLMQRILKNKKAEVFVSFMYEAINRHRGTPEFEPHLDELFGTTRWREAETIADSDARKSFILDLYEAQLRDAGAKFVTRFELWDGGRFVYAIYFATGNAVGCDRMKQAVWRADPTGEFQFRADKIGQISLFGTDTSALQTQIRGLFGGREVDVASLESWIRTDVTQFHSGHLRAALKAMEDTRQLEVVEGTRKRKGTFPAGARVVILKP